MVTISDELYKANCVRWPEFHRIIPEALTMYEEEIKARYDQWLAKSKCEAQYREFIAGHQLKDVYDRLDALCKYFNIKISKDYGYRVIKE